MNISLKNSGSTSYSSSSGEPQSSSIVNSCLVQLAKQEFKNGQYSVVMMYAKHARGAMTRYLVEQNITDIEQLKLYDVDGYQYNDLMSSENEWVFTR